MAVLAVTPSAIEESVRIQLENLSFREDDNFCDAIDGQNATWRLFHESIDRCAAPAPRLRVITPQMLLWSSDRQEEKERKPGRTGSGAPNAAASSKQARRREKTGRSHPFICFLLIAEDDYFSMVLERALKAVVGAFSHQVWFCKGYGTVLTRLTSEFDVRSLPRLLFFKDGRLVSSLSASNSPVLVRYETGAPALAAWLAEQVGALPAAQPLPQPPVPPSPRVDLDLPLVMACLYAVVNAIAFFRRRCRQPSSAGDAEADPG
ncbi:unnamed protein product [Phaeothamnion confervicola]